jgi:hypothetical protein
MQDKLERLIKLVYKNWKQKRPKTQDMHPDEEALTCFLEGGLSKQGSDSIKTHLLSCDSCLEAFSLNFQLKSAEIKEVPAGLLNRVKDLLEFEDKPPILEIILRLQEKALEILRATGDVLVGSELAPAPVLRSRSIKDFKDEVTILKDFKDIRVEARIENKGGKAFNLMIRIKQKQTQELIKDLRVTLLRDDLELESRLTDSGSVTFERVLLGKYTIEISTVDSKVASVLIDIRI